MSNEITNFNPQNASLLEMRANPALYPRIKAMPREQAVFGMSKIVSQAFLYRGQAADEVNVQFIASSLVTELLADGRFGAGNLSLAEIQVVVKMAVLGGSEMFGVSVASLYKVIMEFVKGEGHLIQVKVNEQARQTEEQQMRESVIAPMLMSYTGEFIRKHNIKK